MDYCYQDLNDLPPPYKFPEGRTKPWGTAHAVRAARDVVKAGGLFIAEMKGRQSPDASPLWDLVRDRVYGQTRLAVYRRKLPLPNTDAV